MANQYTKKRDAQRREIFWNLINSGLAGSLVFLGSLSSGNLTWQGVGAGIIAAAIVAVTKFRDYWGKEKKEYTAKIFSWLG
jgi:hypothetical protein